MKLILQFEEENESRENYSKGKTRTQSKTSKNFTYPSERGPQLKKGKLFKLYQLALTGSQTHRRENNNDNSRASSTQVNKTQQQKTTLTRTRTTPLTASITTKYF